MQTIQTDTLIIGAGLMGSSVGMHLARLGSSGDITVIDFDLDGSLSSSELNAGGVRGTFSQPVNILFSKISIDYYAQHALDIGYRDCGYLWLRTAEQMKFTEISRKTQEKLGWHSEILDVQELRKRYPFINKTDDLAGAQFAKRDGLMNPNLLKLHFRKKAQEKGVKFEDRLMVVSAERNTMGFEIECLKFVKNVTEDQKRQALTNQDYQSSVATVKIQASRIVNAAGAWASRLAAIIGYGCPSKPVRRQVCIFDCRDVDLTPYGMTVDPSGVYFHPEATNGLAGIATPGEPSGFDLNYDGASFFEGQIWPMLYERSSHFERLKHLTGWAGLYEVSPDESAIIGQVSDRIFDCHSFSGHGAMHSYAAGLTLAELMVFGRYRSLPETELLSAKRFEQDQLLYEGAVI